MASKYPSVVNMAVNMKVLMPVLEEFKCFSNAILSFKKEIKK